MLQVVQDRRPLLVTRYDEPDSLRRSPLELQHRVGGPEPLGEVSAELLVGCLVLQASQHPLTAQIVDQVGQPGVARLTDPGQHHSREPFGLGDAAHAGSLLTAGP